MIRVAASILRLIGLEGFVGKVTRSIDFKSYMGNSQINDQCSIDACAERLWSVGARREGRVKPSTKGVTIFSKVQRIC